MKSNQRVEITNDMDGDFYVNAFKIVEEKSTIPSDDMASDVDFFPSRALKTKSNSHEI